MNKSYIPAKKADLKNWLANFAALLAASPAVYGVTSGDVATVNAANNAYQSAYTLANDPSTRTPATVQALANAKANALAVVRPIAVAVSLNASISDDNKIALGVTVRTLAPTPVPAPVDAPSLSIIKAAPLSLQLGYKTTGASNKAKPAGVVGVELRRSIGTVAATDPSQCAYLATVTKSPVLLSYGSGDQGKTATYFARFVTRGGPGGIAQSGPWSTPLVLVVM